MKQILDAMQEPNADLSAPIDEFSPSAGIWMVPWRQLGFDFCAVYLIATATRWPVKVGMSDCAAARLAQLQTSHWNELRVWRYWVCENRKAARTLEQKTHELLCEGSRRLLGEWFDMDLEKAAETVVFAAENLGIEIAKEIPETERYRPVFDYLNSVYEKRGRQRDREEARATRGA